MIKKKKSSSSSSSSNRAKSPEKRPNIPWDKITIPADGEKTIIDATIPFEHHQTDVAFDPNKHIKLITWNIASLRTAERSTTPATSERNELRKLARVEKPDVLMLQETRLNCDTPEMFSKIGVLPGYSFVDSVSHARKGYSGTRTYVKDGAVASQEHTFGLDINKPTLHEIEGRVITSHLNFCSPSSSSSLSSATRKRSGAAADNLSVVNTYVVNASSELKRLDYRVNVFDRKVRKYLAALQQRRGETAIWAGDFNVADKDFDRYWSRKGFEHMCHENGFTPEERVSFRKTLRSNKMVDAFRHVYPNARDVFSYWDRRYNLRSCNVGWRIDGFVVSAALVSRIVDCFVLEEYWLSDHAPVVLWLRRL